MRCESTFYIQTKSEQKTRGWLQMMTLWDLFFKEKYVQEGEWDQLKEVLWHLWDQLQRQALPPTALPLGPPPEQGHVVEARSDETREPFHTPLWSKHEVETCHPARADPKFGLPTQLRGRKGIQRAQWNSLIKTQQAGRSASLSTRPECTNYKEGGWAGGWPVFSTKPEDSDSRVKE